MNRLLKHTLSIVLLCCLLAGSGWAQSEAPPTTLSNNLPSESQIPPNHLAALQTADEIVHHDFDPLSGEMAPDMATANVEPVLTPLTPNFTGTWEISTITLVAKPGGIEPGVTPMSQAAILQDVQEMLALQGGELIIQSNGRYIWVQNMMPATGELHLSGNELLLKQDASTCTTCDPFTELRLLQQADSALQLGLDLQDSDKPYFLSFNLTKTAN